MRSTLVAALALATSMTATAQPSDQPDQLKRALSSYVYVMDNGGNKVLVSTKFWRNDPKYDDRAFHRFLDVLNGLEKRGFRQDDKATIASWSGTQPFARCFVYLEDLQAGGRTAKNAPVTTGSRVWCSESGISEQEIKASDGPKHLDQVMQKFDTFLDLAKQNVKK